MAGRAVSAWVSDDVAEAVTLEARREGRSPAQLAAQAIRFFMTLPREARASVNALDNLGTLDQRRAAMNEVARALNNAEFEMTCQRMAPHSLELMPDGMSDGELDAEAVRLTKAALKRGA